MKFICYNRKIRNFKDVTIVLLNETSITVSFIDREMWVIREQDNNILTKLFVNIEIFLNDHEKCCFDIEWEHSAICFSI